MNRSSTGKGHLNVLWLAAGLLVVIMLAGGQRADAGESGSTAWRWETYSQGLPTYAMAVTVGVQPDDPTVIYIGTYEPPGLWRSDDRGLSWARDDLGLEGSPVYALEWDAIRQRWWVGGRNGLYSRPAADAPWQAAGATERAVYAIAEDQRGRLFLATDDGLFCLDGAQGGAAIAMPAAKMTILAVDVSPDGRTLLVGTAGQGMWISFDGGASWRTAADPATQVGEELSYTIVSTVQFDPAAAGMIYAGTSERAYRSSDGGATWQLMTGLEGHVYDFAVGNDGGVYAALTGQVARSADGGQAWELYSAGLRPDDRVLGLAVVPDDSAHLYAAAWDGVYVSSDGGQSWKRHSAGPGYPDVNTLAWDGNGDLLAGTRSGVYRRIQGQPSWEPIPAGDSGGVLTLSDAGNGRDFYAGLSDGIARSADGGQTWSDVPSELTGHGIAGVAADPDDPDHLHVWVAFGRVHESRDGGYSWIARWEGLGDVRPVTAIHQSDGGQLFSGTEDGLYVYDPGEETWQLLELPLHAPSVFVVATDRRERGGIYAGTTDGLWRSKDDGESWNRWGAGLEGKTVTALVRSPTDAEVIFAGTRHAGFFVSGDGGTTWQPAWDGRLATASVRAILFSPDGSEVYVAGDQGIWRGYMHGNPS